MTTAFCPKKTPAGTATEAYERAWTLNEEELLIRGILSPSCTWYLKYLCPVLAWLRQWVRRPCHERKSDRCRTQKLCIISWVKVWTNQGTCARIVPNLKNTHKLTYVYWKLLNDHRVTLPCDIRWDQVRRSWSLYFPHRDASIESQMKKNK